MSLIQIEDAFIVFASSLLHLNENQEHKLEKFDVGGTMLHILEQGGHRDCTVACAILKTLAKLCLSSEVVKAQVESEGIHVISRTLQHNTNHSDVILFGCQILSNLGPKANTSIGIAIACLEAIMLNYDSNISVSCINQLFSTLGVFASINDANKLLIASCSIPSEATRIIEEQVEPNVRGVLGSCAVMVANVSYRQTTASLALLESGLIASIIRICRETYFSLNDDCEDNFDEDIEHVLIAIANVSNSNENCSTVCSIEHSIEFVIQVLQQSDNTSLIRFAALACASMSFDCDYAKRLFRHAHAIEALIDIVLRLGMHDDSHDDKEESAAAEAATRALCTIFTDKVAMSVLDNNVEDFESLVQLYLQTESEIVLLGGSMLVSVLLPAPFIRRSLAAEGRQSFIESKGGEEIIQRCFNKVYFCDEGLCAPWFSELLSILFHDHDEENKSGQQIQDCFLHSDLHSSIDVYKI